MQKVWRFVCLSPIGRGFHVGAASGHRRKAGMTDSPEFKRTAGYPFRRHAL